MSTLSNQTVAAGVTLVVQSGGITVNTTVQSGGAETVQPGGQADSTTVQAGGSQTIQSDGQASGTIVQAGGIEVVSAGGATTSANVSGTETVYGSALGDTVNAYDTQTVYSGGVASGTIVLYAGTESVSAGGTTIGALVSGNENINSGGVASGITIENAGTEYDKAGGTSISAIVYGTDNVNGSAVGATVLSGGTQYVNAGGTAATTTVASHGYQDVYTGATASGTQVHAGGTQNILGGTAVNTTVASGGIQDLDGGNSTASGTQIQGGGSQTIEVGLALYTTVSSGGTQYLDGATATISGTLVLAGGLEKVIAGTAVNTTVSSGGTETVASGATASGGSVYGKLTDLGSATGITVNSGGTLVMSGGKASAVTLDVGGNVDLTTIAYASGDQASVVSGLLTITTSGGSVITTSVGLAGNYAGETFIVTNDGNGGVEVGLCYIRGTRVLTPTGERRIENLKIGDRVVTRFGGIQRIKWIGRQRYVTDEVREDLEIIPVHMRAGALGDDLPARDLYISPGHSMLIGGTLVLAKSLVNGITITQGWARENLDYFQIELDKHDCIVVEGAWSETFADGPGLRESFHNLAEFNAMFPDHRTPGALVALCAPRPERGAALAAALRPVVERARTGVASGPLRGFIDRVDGSWKLDGWAQDADHPELPVLLEVLLENKVIGTVLACDFRKDLFDVFGHGNSSFVFESPVKLRGELLRTLQVRRASDGAAVPINENIRPRAEVPANNPAVERERESVKPQPSLVAGGGCRASEGHPVAELTARLYYMEALSLDRPCAATGHGPSDFSVRQRT